MNTKKFISVKGAMKIGEGEVALRGWVYRFRGSNKIKFLVLRDSTDIVQCVLKQENFSEELWDKIDKLKIESSVRLVGEIKPDERAPTGFEVTVKDIEIVHIAEDYPINKDLNEDLLGDRRHLWLRSRKMTAIMKIRSTIFGAIHEFYRDKGFTEFQSPTILSAAGESGSSVFEVKYFDKKAYLAQTWQLHAETAIFALGKIYCVAPSFRAEKSNTSRHLTEYWHAEMEVPWSTFGMLQDYAEDLMRHVVKKVFEINKEDLEILERDTKTLEATISKRFPHLTYTEAIKLLKKEFDFDIPWGKDLRTIEEDKLSSLYDTPVIVTDYPKAVKAFYMKESPETIDKPEDEKTVQGFDMIGPEGYGELFGASQREESLEVIKENLIKVGENLENYEFYFDSRRYGSIPHGGFGMGVERVISWICGLTDIKDAIAFPRKMRRLSP
ncbi:MAG: asparagine--tRNA ligase [Nanoarchaeota archaeon]|jgi:asparaginyl-tRNA synthetase|nr:asparagine--tRNA ligase [Nanoarchaeota archaeon]